MRQTITERICNLILKYCYNDISKVQHIKCFCDKIIKEKELEAANNLDVAKVGVQLEQVRQQEHSLKDEWLCLFFTLLMAAHFIPAFQPAMDKGWDILQKADPMFWYIILTIVGASFGVTTMNKLKKK